jgi:hypothetical protein
MCAKVFFSKSLPLLAALSFTTKVVLFATCIGGVVIPVAYTKVL